MASTSPARIDDDLYTSAKLAGSVQSRSASQQVAHWARIGREIEASASISPREIAAVLAGAASYDSLDPKAQAVVRAAWSARMDELRGTLDLAASFEAAGRTWVELDDAGKVVERAVAGRRRSSKPPSTRAAAKTTTTRSATKAVSAARKPAAKRARAAG